MTTRHEKCGHTTSRPFHSPLPPVLGHGSSHTHTHTLSHTHTHTLSHTHTHSHTHSPCCNCIFDSIEQTVIVLFEMGNLVCAPVVPFETKTRFGRPTQGNTTWLQSK